jgi:hypothetical protein
LAVHKKDIKKMSLAMSTVWQKTICSEIIGTEKRN